MNGGVRLAECLIRIRPNLWTELSLSTCTLVHRIIDCLPWFYAKLRE